MAVDLGHDFGIVAHRVVMDAFLRSHGLTCLVAMMAYTDAVGGFRRELAVYMPDPALAACLTVILEASDLGLGRICPARLAIPDHIMFFKQRNTSFSRKKMQPMLHRFFSSQDSG